MKFSPYNKKNQLDEMQEQTMLSIEARGFWLLWAGLLLAILVQIILGTPNSNGSASSSSSWRAAFTP